MIGIVGCGGLGNYVSLFLTLAGKEILIVDKDIVEEKNLERQGMYDLNDLCKPKVFVLKEKLEKRKGKIKAYFGDFKEILNELKKCELIIDCLDNWEDRKILFNFCKENKIPLVHGAVDGLRGQVALIFKSYDLFLRFKGKGRGTTGYMAALIASLQTHLTLSFLEGKIKEEIFIRVNLENFSFDIFKI